MHFCSAMVLRGGRYTNIEGLCTSVDMRHRFRIRNPNPPRPKKPVINKIDKKMLKKKTDQCLR